MIIGTEISKQFIGSPILDGVSFKIGNNKKVALVGKNGCGKSTLMKIIAGVLEYDTGSISKNNELIAYIPQEFNFPNISVGEYLHTCIENEWEFYKIDILKEQLGFNNFVPEQLISSLSEGQKMKLKLIEVLLLEPTTLLIDEPTNHLDIDGILWFEKLIKSMNKNVLMISHDRQFLNNIVSEIWEIENHKLSVFVGNYDFYKMEKDRLIGKWNQEYILFQKKKEKLEALYDRYAGTYGVKAVKSRISRELEGTSEKVPYTSKKIKEIDFKPGVTHSKRMVHFKNVFKTYDGNKFIFKNFNFELRGGEKVWLFGPNGAGKSTLVKMILGIEKPSNGEVEIGENISIGYFAQKQNQLNYEKSLLDNFLDITHCEYREVFGALKKFLFDGDLIKLKVKDLSPGQRARFAFAIFTYHNYDMLILDEPDNHLDIETKEVIEESLKNYKGTLFLISHDRYFVSNLEPTSVLCLKDGVLEKL
ncbi:ABC transporter ATP-binding protein [bacterium]|nr:ABC transporter ATP-binding protein [bacterium]